MVEDKLSDAQRQSEEAINSNMKTRVTVVLTQVDEVLGLEIDEDSDGEEE